MAIPVVLIGAAKVAGAFLAKVGIVAAATTAVAVGATALADSPLGRPVVGALKFAGKTIGKGAKGLWGAAKKIPVLGNVFKGIEKLPHAIWSTAKKTPVIGRLCNIAEEKFYNFKAGFNKGFVELRAMIAKLKAKLVELLFKVLDSLKKETKENGKKAIDDMKKEKKAVSKSQKKDMETPSRDHTKDISRSEPEPVKTAAKGKAPVVTTDISQKINSVKGIAAPGSAAPIIAAGKGVGQKAIEKPVNR